MSRTHRLATALTLVLEAAGCGGLVVFEEPGAGGAGGAASTTSAPSSTKAATATTGAGPCDEHADCAPDLCIFSTGECARACQAGTCDACGSGRFCEPCGTSSCPDCNDCVAVCAPLTAGRCDDDDPCSTAEACMYGFGGVCYPRCSRCVWAGASVRNLDRNAERPE